MTGPGAMSASALSEQVEVPQPTLSKWLRMAGVDSSYGFPNNVHEYSKMTKIKGPKRPNDWSAEDKLKVVMDESRGGRPFYLYISIFNRSSDMLADLYPKQKRRNVAVTPFEISGAEGRT